MATVMDKGAALREARFEVEEFNYAYADTLDRFDVAAPTTPIQSQCECL